MARCGLPWSSDSGPTQWEPNHDRFNRFVNDFLLRGGTAHAIVMYGHADGITRNFVMNAVKNSGGYYESMAIANVLPDKLKALAEHIDANCKAMSDWYELEYASDDRAQSAQIQVGTRREGVLLQMSINRPF